MNFQDIDLAMLADPARLADAALPVLTNVAAALAIFFIGKWVIAVLVRLLRSAMRRAGTDETLISFLGNVAYGVGLAVVVISALGQLGVDTTSAAAVLGGAALAIGLSLQGQLSSLAAGVILIIFRPFRKGEVVEIAGRIGTVDEINMVSTRLINVENHVITLPNNSVVGSPIVNYTRMPWRRIDLTVGIGYGSDLRKAKQLLEQILAEDERILKEPPPVVLVKELADSSVNFAVRGCVNTPDFFVTRCELIEKIKLRFDEHGIEIPFPQRDVHVRDWPATLPAPQAAAAARD